MGVVQTKAFRSGNSVAVRLPARFGVAAGASLTIEQVGRELRIAPADLKAEGRDRMQRLVQALDAIGPVDPAALSGYDRDEERVDLPDRASLY